jgi:glycosyltransferase involved in cell wall biosynthesis
VNDTGNGPEYSVVVPVYRGGQTLAALYERLVKVLVSLPGGFEIIFVEDCSPDDSWKVLEELYSKDRRIRLVQLSRNYGQHAATICGLSCSRGRYVITLDDDLQHPPEEIPRLIEEVKKGYSLVYGKYLKKKHGWFRNLGSRLTNKALSRITSSQYDLTSFRVIEGRIARAIVEMGSPNCILDILAFNLIPAGGISFCTVQHDESKQSNYGVLKLVSVSMDIVMNYSVFPLRIASVVGIITSVIGFFCGVYYLVKFFMNQISVSGFTTIVLLVIFFSGIIIFMLGIIGEYLGRIFLTVRKKPLYVVKQMLSRN